MATKLRIRRWRHMSIAPRLLLRTIHQAMARGEDWREFFENVPEGATWEEYESRITEVEGAIVMGPCDNVGEDGRCMGHEE